MELAPRSQQEDIFLVHPEEDKLLMEGQNLSPPGMAGTAQSGGSSMRLPPGLPPMPTGVMMPFPVGKPSKESLHTVVKPVAIYSALVYKDMVTRELGVTMQTFQLQEQDALNQGHGVVITEL